MRTLAVPNGPSIVARSSQGLGARGVGVDLLLAVALAILAAVIRWPYLWLVPRFTDETLEVRASLAILRDGVRPLTNYDTYYGALYNYLVAAALALSDESPFAPRLVVYVAGVLTVVVTYGLGRTLGERLAGNPDVALRVGRCVGLLAATLLAVNGAHAAINSHVAWSNCLTPVFTTAALWALLLSRSQETTPTMGPLRFAGSPRGGRRQERLQGRLAPPLHRDGEGVGGNAVGLQGRSWGLPLAGLLLGLAVQTHPLVIALLPGVAVGMVWGRWRLLRTAGPWLAALCFLIGYANMLAFNAQTDLESLRSAQRMSAEYGQDQQASVGYLRTGASMGLLLARIVGGAVDQRAGWPAYLLDPEVLTVAVLAGAGVVLAARRGEILPLTATVSFLLILPAANPKFTTLITSRYLMPIVPLLFACASLALVTAVSFIRCRRPEWRTGALIVGVGVAVVLAIVPLVGLARYYDRALSRSDTNERILRLTSEIQAARRDGEMVLIDEGIGSELPDTGITEVRGFESLLDFARVPYRLVRPSPGRLQDELDAAPTALAVLSARDASVAGARVRLEPLDSRPPAESGRMTDFRLYRISRARA
jgi:4-amino-4-deoxy-L-arabinose transferase-like glycosyltransferase